MPDRCITGGADLPCGQVLRVDVDGLPVCLVHAEDGGYFAIGDTCSHEEASLSDGWTYGHQIECPLHNSVFDLETGSALSLPATDPVPVYPVAVHGHDLLVSVPSAAQTSSSDARGGD